LINILMYISGGRSGGWSLFDHQGCQIGIF
jgi:hypothetical protein